MLKLETIISGGQTGADRGGIEAGKLLGLKTGGTAPPNFMTENGSDPTLGSIYGLIEGEFDNNIYPKRTKKNVKNADGTAWFGSETSRGAILTINTTKKLKKYLIINPTPTELANWLIANSIKVLNIAGNRESINVGICQHVTNIIIETYKIAVEIHSTTYKNIGLNF